MIILLDAEKAFNKNPPPLHDKSPGEIRERFKEHTIKRVGLSSWPEGFHGNPQIAQAVAKTIGCSVQTDSKASLLMPTPTQFIEPGKVKLLASQNLPLYSSGLGTGRFLNATKRETQTPTQS